jgi:hypothetical protein
MFGDALPPPAPVYRLLGRVLHERALREALVAWSSIASAIIRENQSPVSSPIAFHWRPSRVLDAYALTPWIGDRIILVSVGFYGHLQGAPNRIFSCSDLMDTIGDPEREKGRLVEARRSADWVDGRVGPVCPVRRQASFLTAEFAVVFVTLHELAHHRFGDTDTGHGEGFIARTMHESGERRARPAEVPRRHLSEVRADRFAFETIRGTLDDHGALFPDQIVDEALRGRLTVLSALAHAIAILSLTRPQRPVEAYDRFTHPHPIVRFAAVHTRSCDREMAAYRDAARYLAAMGILGRETAAITSEQDAIVQRAAALRAQLDECNHNVN